MKVTKLTILAAAAALVIGASTAQAETIKIGAAGPYTGDLASFGDQLKAGAEAAVRDINAAGGVLGKQLELVLGDDQCDPKQAVAVANKMASEGVVFVSGHFCSGSSIPASDVYEEEGIVQISPASTNPAFTDAGKWNVFRVCGRDDQQGIVAGGFLAKNFADRKIAIVHDKQAYSKGLADETKKALNAAGVREAVYDTITPGEQDYSALVTKLKGAGIQVLYYGGYHPEAGLIVRQMRDQGMDTVLVSGDALVTEEYWSITGDSGAGTLMTFSPDPRKNPGAADIVKSFKDAGVEPEGYVLYAYGAVQAWASAAEAAGTTDPEKVAEALKAQAFATVLGELSFDEKGDVTLPGYVVYEWQAGTYAYYKD